MATVGASPVGVEESMVAAVTAAWDTGVVLWPGWLPACRPQESTGSEGARAVGTF